MDSSVYCLPADLLGEGAERVATQLRDRAGGPGLPLPGLPLPGLPLPGLPLPGLPLPGLPLAGLPLPGLPLPGLPLPGLTVAACYHASRDILPHNPVYRVSSMAPGAFYHVDPSAYPGALRPAHSPSADGRDILAEACQAAGRLGLPVSAWAVLLHRDDLSASGPEVQENCFGDRFPGRLCPAKPAVRDYVLAMVRDLCRYPIAALRAEALHYQGASHGHHHERCLEDYGELARWLLGLCFCPSCTAAGTAHGADVPALAARCRTYLASAFDGSVPPVPADAHSLTEACGPDILAYQSARTDTVTALARAATGEAAQAGVRLTLLDETIPAQAYATGHGFDPAHVAVRAEMGVDPHALAQAGIHLEEPVYLTEPADAATAIAWYRTQLGPAAPLSILLRPGPPDTRSELPPPDTRPVLPAPDALPVTTARLGPSDSPRPDSSVTPPLAASAPLASATLREKAQLARAHNCTELNFYAYGLYRLQSLDHIRHALSAP